MQMWKSPIRHTAQSTGNNVLGCWAFEIHSLAKFLKAKQIWDTFLWWETGVQLSSRCLFHAFALKIKLYLSWHAFLLWLQNRGANSKVTDKKIKCSFSRRACQEYGSVSQHLDVRWVRFKNVLRSGYTPHSSGIFLRSLCLLRLIKTAWFILRQSIAQKCKCNEY